MTTRARIYVVLCLVAVAATMSTVPAPSTATPADSEQRASFGNTLRVGERLLPSQVDPDASRLTSANSDFFFEIYVYTPGRTQAYAVLDVGQTPRTLDERATWRRSKRATDDAFAVLRPNGNFVMYAEPGRPVWSTGTAGTGRHNRLVIRDDGNLVMYGKGDRIVWSSGTGRALLERGDTLRPGQRLTSVWPDGDWPTTVEMRRDGNLVVKFLGGVVWASNTTRRGAYLRVSDDGDLVIRHGSKRLWAVSRTDASGRARPYLEVRHGNFMLVDAAKGEDLWDSEDRTGESFLLAPGDLRILLTGSTLSRGDALASPNGHRLVMQPNGNLVLRRSDGRRVWSSGTGGNPGATFEIRPSGNLVVSHRDTTLWSSGPSRCNAYRRPVSVIVSRTSVLTARDGYGDICWTSTRS